MYRTYNDGIESVKRRQWTATNYVLLMFAAIIGFANLVMVKGELSKYPYPWLPLVLLLISFLISAAGIYHLIDMHRVITEYRYTFINIIRMSYAEEIDPYDYHNSNFSKYFDWFNLLFIDMHRVMTEYRKLRNINRMSYDKELDPIKDHYSNFFKYFYSFTLLFIFLIMVGLGLVGFFLSTKSNSLSFWTDQGVLFIPIFILIFIDFYLVERFSFKAYGDTQEFKKYLDKKHKLP